MDLKINREMLGTTESIYDGLQEQSVELDYILPDYCPDIFRLVKCCVTPSVVSRSVNSDTLSYELSADIRILYCSENSPTLHCISQKMTFSKSIRLSEAEDKVSVSLIPKTDHINCRVVNPRRIDMRGAVSIKIKVSAQRSHEVICDIFGMNSQCRKKPVEFAAKKLSAFRTITVSDNIELNASSNPITAVIRISAIPEITEKKIVANKLVIKGEARINILYSTENGLETILSKIPFSQIADMEGLDESFICNIKTDIVSCDATPVTDSDGNAGALKCDLRINLDCSAVKTLPSELVTDVYSTTYPCEFALSRLKIQKAPAPVSESLQNSITLQNENGAIDCVYSAWCNAKNINTSIDSENECIIVSGMAEFCVMIKNETGMPSVLEKSEAFEYKIPVSGITDSSSVDINVTIPECDYTISSSDTISLKAEILITGQIGISEEIEAVTEVSFNGDVRKVRDGDYALKLYYGVEGEYMWEIAKKYSTSVRAIMEENDLESETLTSSGMLLIPIV